MITLCMSSGNKLHVEHDYGRMRALLEDKEAVVNRKRTPCWTCRGWGVKTGERCETCGGHGFVEEDGAGCLGLFVGLVVVVVLVAVVLVVLL